LHPAKVIITCFQDGGVERQDLKRHFVKKIISGRVEKARRGTRTGEEKGEQGLIYCRKWGKIVVSPTKKKFLKPE